MQKVMSFDDDKNSVGLKLEEEQVGIHEIKIKKNNSLKKQSFNKHNNEKFLQSEDRLINLRKNITKKDSLNTNEIIEKESQNIENNVNINSNLKNIESENSKKNGKSLFGKTFEWVNYIFNEIPLFWKSEEMVEGYDANGNIVKRPKKKIPLKDNPNNIDINDENATNEANSNGLDYAKKTISYGVYFN